MAWSKERHPDQPNLKQFAPKPTIFTTDYIQAYQWIKNSRITIREENVFYSRASNSSNSNEFAKCEIKQYKQAVRSNYAFANFADYNSIIGIGCTVLNREDFLQSTCSCFSYLKQNKCKHIIGLAALEKLSTTKSVPIGQKPKRGRQQATSRALVRQPEEAAPVQQQAQLLSLILRQLLPLLHKRKESNQLTPVSHLLLKKEWSSRPESLPELRRD